MSGLIFSSNPAWRGKSTLNGKNYLKKLNYWREKNHLHDLFSGDVTKNIKDSRVSYAKRWRNVTFWTFTMVEPVFIFWFFNGKKQKQRRQSPLFNFFGAQFPSTLPPILTLSVRLSMLATTIGWWRMGAGVFFIFYFFKSQYLHKKIFDK